MSARALPFLVFPMVIMLVAILMNSSGPAINGQSTAQFCSTPGNSGCPAPGSAGSSYFCQPTSILGALQACKILPNCSAPPYPGPAFCVNDVLTATAAGCAFQFISSGTAGCGVYLPANSNVYLPTAQIQSSLSTTAAFFTFSASGTSGFITIIGIAVGIISLLGITALGSGESTEGLHVLFMGGMVLGMWLVLSGIEGFVSGSGDLFFSSINVAIAGAGTFLYVVMTFSVVIGFTGLVSRGS